MKDFSNLSSASLCLRGIHKLDMRKKPRRNEVKHECINDNQKIWPGAGV